MANSERRPEDVSLESQALDVRHVIEMFGFERTVVIGQSIGGRTAILVAPGSPELVEAVVIVEADPDEGNREQVEETSRWLNGWPALFPSEQDARRFFLRSGLEAAPWEKGLEKRGGLLWPRFEATILTQMLEQADPHTIWGSWRSVTCPTLVVSGAGGQVSPELALRMAGEGPRVHTAEIEGGGHDLHLRQPGRWRDALEDFLDSMAAE